MHVVLALTYFTVIINKNKNVIAIKTVYTKFKDVQNQVHRLSYTDWSSKEVIIYVLWINEMLITQDNSHAWQWNCSHSLLKTNNHIIIVYDNLCGNIWHVYKRFFILKWYRLVTLC